MLKKFIIPAIMFGCLGSISLAADSGKPADMKKHPPLTAEQREKMADMHEKMAACLRSDKPVSLCHEEMMKMCQESMGKDGCPMMGKMMGKGDHHHMMHEGEGKE